MDRLLKDISKEYNIEYGELKAKYIPGSKQKGTKGNKCEYVEAYEEVYQGQKVIVDINNIVYVKEGKQYVIVGYKNKDAIVFVD